MTITLCGSLSHADMFIEAKVALEKKGHTVLLPHSVEAHQPKAMWKALKESHPEEYVRRKQERMRGHFKKIESSDAVLVLNYEKKDVPNYIGPNTLIEMGIAFHLGKTLYMLNPIPDLWLKDEVEAMQPTMLAGDLDKMEDA